MTRLLVICGPTATGKTKLALKLARQFNGELVSADSRQVYKGMNVGTGKDIPTNFQFSSTNFQRSRVGCYTDGQVKIWGLDLVDPDEEFSVSSYVQFAIPVILDIVKRGKLPIVVGGTGLYIKALLEPLFSIYIPPNKPLRKKLQDVSVDTLQKELKKVSEKQFEQMNASDKNNPRRLIRAIEIALYEGKKQPFFHFITKQYLSQMRNCLVVCLATSPTVLKQRISDRVEKRVKQGIVKEIEKLLDNGYSWNLPTMSGLGYKEWKPLFEVKGKKFHQKTKQTRDPLAAFRATRSKHAQDDTLDLKSVSSVSNEEMKEKIIKQWKRDEYRYAKRQLTWFKKQKNMHWFNVSHKRFQKDIVDLVGRWYNKNEN